MRPNGPQIITSMPHPPAGTVRWPSDGSTRVLERAAILETEAAWRRAYQRRPATRRELAVAKLLAMLPELAAATDPRSLSRAE